MTWRERAACAGMEPEVFFPASAPGQNIQRYLDEALAICAGCPVVAECAEAGRRERHGVWGGEYRGARGQGSMTGRCVDCGAVCSSRSRLCRSCAQRSRVVA